MEQSNPPALVRLSEGLGPLVEVGWRYVPSEVWGDQVLTQDPKAAQLAREYGRDVQPLFTGSQLAAAVATAVAIDGNSRAMFVGRLENMQAHGDKWLTVEAVLALLNDCDMLASRA